MILTVLISLNLLIPSKVQKSFDELNLTGSPKWKCKQQTYIASYNDPVNYYKVSIDSSGELFILEKNVISDSIPNHIKVSLINHTEIQCYKFVNYKEKYILYEVKSKYKGYEKRYTYDGNFNLITNTSHKLIWKSYDTLFITVYVGMIFVYLIMMF